MEKFVLRRDGDRPLGFFGERLAAASSQADEGPSQSRWHEADIYRLESGTSRRWVLALRFRSLHKGEQDGETAIVLDSPAEVMESLTQINPFPLGIGYPEGEQYRDRQARLRAEITQACKSMVGKLLAAAGPEFEETL